MASLNRVELIGNVGQVYETKVLPSGAAVVQFSLATNQSYKDRETGERKTYTEWHRLTAYEAQAKVVADYVTPGRELYVEARLKYGKYDKDGTPIYTTDLVVKRLQLLGSRPGADDKTSKGSAPAGVGVGEDFDDDVPF